VTALRKVWGYVAITAALVALVVLTLLGRGDSIGARLGAYLRKRDDAEAKAKAAADESLAKLHSHIADANKEINHAAGNPADAINRSGR